ncbi:MAG TPA: hypothetical protein DDW65_10430 [Firmicutes bacterium]|jgi:putative restriction endonuclease|nr:hypothetical protein [Bacillota bacterium]
MKYRSKNGKIEIDPVIGCIILTSPFFFDEPEWIPVPADWSPNIVQGKRKTIHSIIHRPSLSKDGGVF